MTASSGRSALTGACESWNTTLPCFTRLTRAAARSTSGCALRSSSCPRRQHWLRRRLVPRPRPGPHGARPRLDDATGGRRMGLRHRRRPRRRPFRLPEEQRGRAEPAYHYRSINLEVLGHQTIWCGLLLRRHRVPAVRRSMERWWEHVLRYSRRDQLSFPFVLSQSSASAVVHDIDNHRSRFHQWPLWQSGTARADRTSVWNADTPDLKELKARIAELEEQLAQAGREVELLRGDLVRASSRTAELLASTSWKVTAPGRAISQWAKEVAQRLRPAILERASASHAPSRHREADAQPGPSGRARS